jgi:hypothetical protein
MAIDQDQVARLQRLVTICGDVSSFKQPKRYVCQLEPGHPGMHSEGALSWSHGDGANAVAISARESLPDLISDLQRLQRIEAAAVSLARVFDDRAALGASGTVADLRRWGTRAEAAMAALWQALEIGPGPAPVASERSALPA